MAQFNSRSNRSSNVTTLLGTVNTEVINHEGGTGFLADVKSELYLAVVSALFKDSFYESKDNRLKRIIRLTQTVAVNDPTWIASFVKWLRADGNIRTASVVIALESADTMIKSGIQGSRAIVDSALQRADEPGEAVGYWLAKKGRKIPSAVKRGISDAVVRLYNEYSYAKYDSASKAVRFRDVLQLVHPKPSTPEQSDLFSYILEKSYSKDAHIPQSLEKTRKREAFNSLEPWEVQLLLGESGGLSDYLMTWETYISKMGSSSSRWEDVIPHMGYMALLRNLRNFREAGVSSEVYNGVLEKLADKDQVARSKQFPFRFLSAYYANGTHLETAVALEKALNHSLQNVPSLPGHSLILVDRSGSMFNGYYSDRSELDFADKAAIFGIALALRAEKATLVEFGTSSQVVKFTKGDSILPLLKKFTDLGGTNTVAAINRHYHADTHDRVINLTDEQYNSYGRNPSQAISQKTPYFVFNLNGYAASELPDEPNRFRIGGLTDQMFSLIPQIEAGQRGNWPWAS